MFTVPEKQAKSRNIREKGEVKDSKPFGVSAKKAYV